MRSLLICLIVLSASTASASTRVTLADFDDVTPPFTVWVVNIPNENASVRLSEDHPSGGAHSLQLHYKFLANGPFQYLGIPVKTEILAPVHTLRFMLYGDGSNCSYGVRLTDASGETHQYGKNTGQGGLVAFRGWKEVVIDLDSAHETWDGDKNGKLDYPLTEVSIGIGQPVNLDKPSAAEGELYFDSLAVDADKSVAETLGLHITVVSPEYCSEVTGDVRVRVSAPGCKSLSVKCRKGGGRFGTDSTVAAVTLNARGEGSFVFPADRYPHGPVTLRISGASGNVADNCYLQLYNKSGVSDRPGMPADPPPAARGMSLVFADDFNTPLSISSTDPKAVYYDHKPPDGHQDFSVHTFAGRESSRNPFAQVDTYLRIRASDATHASGLISSLKSDGTGIKASLPCYFECRFLGPNAVGAWPGFWLMTDYLADYKLKGDKTPCDELDIIEAYGGEGPRRPNAGDSYMITPHCWNQGDAARMLEKKAFEAMHNPIHMHKFGIPSSWFEAFHTYGCKVDATDTIYFCDDVEVGRHATLPICKEQPLFFMINLATGGGWPVDLSRYHGKADMYIDYVRVYKQPK